MEIEIESKRNNSLLSRTEVYFNIKHTDGKTPNRDIIKSELAGKLNAKKDVIIIDIIKSSFGIQETKGYAKIYSSNKKLEEIERKYKIKRNTTGKKQDKKEEPKEEKAEKPADADEKKEETSDQVKETPKEEKKPEEKPKEESEKQEETVENKDEVKTDESKEDQKTLEKPKEDEKKE